MKRISINQLRIIAAFITGVVIISIMAACGKVEALNDSAPDPQEPGIVTDAPEDTTDNDDTQASAEPVEPEAPVTDESVTDEIPEPILPEEPEAIPMPEPEDNADSVFIPTENVTPSSSVDREAIVDIATKQLGVPFKQGGSSPDEGFDSSGFTYYCVNEAGTKFPRSISAQLDSGTLLTFDQLRAGDVVYFSSKGDKTADFCGIYVGGGLMIYSPVPDDFVKTANITTNYWTEHFVTGLRLG